MIVCGKEGVWRLQHLDFESADEEVQTQLLTEVQPLQPEWNEEFVLMEFSSGTVDVQVTV